MPVVRAKGSPACRTTASPARVPRRAAIKHGDMAGKYLPAAVTIPPDDWRPRRHIQKHVQQALGFWLPGMAHQPPALPAAWQAAMQLGFPPRQPSQPVSGAQAQQAKVLVLSGYAHQPSGFPEWWQASAQLE